MKNKNVIIFIFCLIIAVSLFFLVKVEKNKVTDKHVVRLAEVTHSIFYAPLYVAIENGYFEEEGIELDLILTSGADKVSAAVF